MLSNLWLITFALRMCNTFALRRGWGYMLRPLNYTQSIASSLILDPRSWSCDLIMDSARESLKYHPGFGSEISSEALPGALPVGQVCLKCLFPEHQSIEWYTHVCRTTPSAVPMVYTVSNCLGQLLLLLERPTKDLGFIVFDHQWSISPSKIWNVVISLTTSALSLPTPTR